MNSQLFFLLNLAVGAFFVLWFLSGRKGRGARGTPLNMRPDLGPAPHSKGRRTPMPPPPPPPVESRLAPTAATERASRSMPPPANLFDKPVEKTLNVRFIYNGHDWQAYEVLGLPAGASLPTVTARYQELIKTADRGQLEFYEAAYQAILRKV